MRLGIKAKQVLGVTTIVGTIVVVLSVMQLARLAEVRLDESRARAELLANAIFHRAHSVVGEGADPYAAQKNASARRSPPERALSPKTSTSPASVDTPALVAPPADPLEEGHPLPPAADLRTVMAPSRLSQLRAIYS